MGNWKEIMHVADWYPRKGFGWKGPRLINDRGQKRFMFFSQHEPWSITWRRFMQIEPQSHRYTKRVWLRFDRHGWKNGSGQMHLAMFCWFVISYHWQQHMRYSPAPKCTLCGDRIDADSGTACGRAGVRKQCAMPAPDDKRAVYKRWKSERRPTNQEPTHE